MAQRAALLGSRGLPVADVARQILAPGRLFIITVEVGSARVIYLHDRL